MALTRAAIIVIVLVGCLFVTALGAALFRHYNPLEDEARAHISHEQSKYMRLIRMRNNRTLEMEALASMRQARDLESRYTSEDASVYGNPTPNTNYYQNAQSVFSHPHPQQPHTPNL